MLSPNTISYSIWWTLSLPTNFRTIIINFNSFNSEILNVKGITKFWYGVMNLVQMNILETYAILQYSVIVVAVEIES